jgi:uncharacterized protein
MTVHVSRAEVATDAPARYAKQLVSHLGRRLEFTTDGNTSTAAVGAATASVTVGERVLTLAATGADRDAVDRAAHVLGSHLDRFGQRNELTVTWVHTTSERP